MNTIWVSLKYYYNEKLNDYSPISADYGKKKWYNSDAIM